MYDYPQPGQEQERLGRLTGQWDSHVKFYFQPGAPPMEKMGRYTAKMDLGGYFLNREFEVALDDAGDFKRLDFHGRGLTGFNPYERKYLGVWVDSGSPAVYHTEGSFDDTGDVFTETSEGPDPEGRYMRMRLVTEVLDEDHQRFRISQLIAGGEERLVTEMIHTRKK